VRVIYGVLFMVLLAFNDEMFLLHAIPVRQKPSFWIQRTRMLLRRVLLARCGDYYRNDEG
jgi:hypothetical protein